MRDIDEKIREQKRLRLEREKDDRIAKIQRRIGENPKRRCKHCGRLPLVGHTDECKLRTMNLEMLDKAVEDGNILLKKNINRQRIFKSDKPRWSGAPPFQKTLVKKRTTKNRGPVVELQKCRVCCAQTLKIATKDGMVCRECGHSKPCEFDPVGLNLCQLCLPTEENHEEQ
jgi:hypothetical protein